jgi:Flp pilus assembly protein TadD
MLDPHDLYSLHGRAMATLKMEGGDVEEAIADLRKAIQLDPKNAFGYSCLADALRQAGEVCI